MIAKSPTLRECSNPDCDDDFGRPFVFYGYGNDKYCCKQCSLHVRNTKTKEYRMEWRHIQQIKARSMGEFWDGSHKVLLNCEK